ncbi:hypothetical protein [Hoyosella altamirensis]|uniref:Uncharacterized protein n=1 Tax=Hoyosella altamirensis TaxID=616997 RepID=A0A839RMC4_9ACTN|nr:hypothetical protein [Hoyosella altamirensis]MBB3038072.1 hypothetical protein [Hoyosella altamirensis]
MSKHGSARRTSVLALLLLCGGLTACAPSAPTPQETPTPTPTETVVPQVEESAGEVEQLPLTLERAD